MARGAQVQGLIEWSWTIQLLSGIVRSESNPTDSPAVRHHRDTIRFQGKMYFTQQRSRREESSIYACLRNEGASTFRASVRANTSACVQAVSDKVADACRSQEYQCTRTLYPVNGSARGGESIRKENRKLGTRGGSQRSGRCCQNRWGSSPHRYRYR